MRKLHGLVASVIALSGAGCSLMLDFGGGAADVPDGARPGDASVVSDASAADALPSDPFEPNDVPSQAKPLALDVSVAAELAPAGDHDFFSLASSEGVTVVLTFEPSLGDLDLRVLSGDGGFILGASGGITGTEQITITSLPLAGAVLVEVYGATERQVNAYTLVATKDAGLP